MSFATVAHDRASAVQEVSGDGYQLYCGDCSVILPNLAASSVDCILADPPYGIVYNSKSLGAIANDRAPFVWWLGQAERLLSDIGVLVCWCRYDVAESFRHAIDWAGLQLAGQLVWDRMLHGQGDCTRQPAPQHDVAWVATKGKWTFPASRGKSVLRHLRERGGFGECEKGLLHPTMKPISLMEELVLTYSAPGQTILDPTMGGGSTGVAAVKHGRKFVGIELDASHFATCVRRVGDASRNVSMFCGLPQVQGETQLSLIEDIDAGHVAGNEEQ